MDAFDVLGDPVRRRILDLLAGGEHAAGAVVDAISAEFGIGQAAVSMQLKVLRENGFALVRAEGNRRIYRLDPTGPAQARSWLDQLAVAVDGWRRPLDALATEVARGRRDRRRVAADGRVAGDQRGRDQRGESTAGAG